MGDFAAFGLEQLALPVHQKPQKTSLLAAIRRTPPRASPNGGKGTRAAHILTTSMLDIGQEAVLALCKPLIYHLNTLDHSTITFFTVMKAVAKKVSQWAIRSAVGSQPMAQAIARMPVSTTTGITFSNTAERRALLVGYSFASYSSRQRTSLR